MKSMLLCVPTQPGYVLSEAYFGLIASSSCCKIWLIRQALVIVIYLYCFTVIMILLYTVTLMPISGKRRWGGILATWYPAGTVYCYKKNLNTVFNTIPWITKSVLPSVIYIHKLKQCILNLKIEIESLNILHFTESTLWACMIWFIGIGVWNILALDSK